jgi:glycosyltransferase involved in cell wall biosynthesis
MHQSDSEVYFVNKYSWLSQYPMVSVSIMRMYALAKTGITCTLIAEGDPATDWAAQLQERFGLDAIPTFRVQLFRRTLFGRVRFTPKMYLQACVHIARSCHRRKRTIVISRNTTFLPWLVVLRVLCRCVVIFESHAYHGDLTMAGFPARHKRRLFCMSNQYRLVERVFLNSCDGLVCQSQVQQQLYVKDYVRIPTAVIPLGAPEYDNGGGGGSGAHSPMRKIAACIGKYFKYVDSDTMLDAVTQCRDLGVSLLWIGLQEAERGHILSEVRKRGMEDLCDLRGWMPHRAMLELLSREAGVGIVSYEPTFHTYAMVSPTKVFDYFAAGLPVIGPDMPSVADHVRNGQDGILYEPGNASSLAGALKAVFANEAEYREMRIRAAESGRRCSWDRRAEELSAFIRRIV